MKVSELTGPALDWAVAKCASKRAVLHDDGITRCVMLETSKGLYAGRFNPSTDWAQGGPIIEREGITIQTDPTDAIPDAWSAYFRDRLFNEDGTDCFMNGPTPLVVAMRCYVASKLGETVDVPAELIA